MPRAVALAALLALAPAAAAARPAGEPPAFAFDWAGKVADVARGMDASDPAARYEAVQRLGGMSIAWTRPYLLRALSDESDRVRSAAGKILAQHGVRAAIPIVLRWLSSDDKLGKVAAAEVLGALADPATVAPLIRSLADPEADVRVAVVDALGAIGGAGAVVPLIGRLEDDKAEVRQAAVRQLLALGDRRAVIPLVAAFGDSNREVRVAAIAAVGRLGDPAAVPPLRRLLRDPEEAVKAEVIAALGNLGALETSELLIAQLGSGNDTLRSRAAYALGQLARRPDAGARGRAALDALATALELPALRGAAREALLAAGPAAVPALTTRLETRLDGDPAPVVELLRELGDRRATPALLAELGRGRVNQGDVLAALAALGDPRALVPILGLVGGADAAVRLHAMRALGPLLAQAGPAAGDVLVARLADPELEVRVRAAEGLGVVRARGAVGRLIELAAGARELDLRRAAITALGAIGDRRAVPTLIDVLRDAPDGLHLAAAEALSYLADPASIAPLRALAGAERSSSRPTRSRATIVRALGGVLRDRRDDDARDLLIGLATRDRLPVSLAALAALSAMRDPGARGALLGLLAVGDLDRRRAALEALGNLRDRGLRDRFVAELGAADDALAATAAWALGKLGDAAAVPALRRALRRTGFATPIAAAAALALVAGPADAAILLELLDHRDRWVRADAAWGLGRLRVGAAAAPLAARLAGDPSWVVRRNAARALSGLGPPGRAALGRAAEHDDHPDVRLAARAALRGRFVPPARTEWRELYVVDPTSDDARVRAEPYVVVASDGLVTAFYTDARGEAAEEWSPPGPALTIPRGRERDH